MYLTIITARGRQKLAESIASGVDVSLTHMAIGDGGGSEVDPTEPRTALVNEVNRGALSSVVRHPSIADQITAERTLPPELGGWSIREIGIIDSDGELFAYGNFPETYKPVLAAGSARELVIRTHMAVSATELVEIYIDQSSIAATQAWVLQQLLRGRPLRYFHDQH